MAWCKKIYFSWSSNIWCEKSICLVAIDSNGVGHICCPTISTWETRKFPGMSICCYLSSSSILVPFFKRKVEKPSMIPSYETSQTCFSWDSNFEFWLSTWSNIFLAWFCYYVHLIRLMHECRWIWCYEVNYNDYTFYTVMEAVRNHTQTHTKNV